MPDKPISPLRQHLIDAMTARRYGEKVQKAYVRHVRTFTAFLGRSPDRATSEDLGRFQLHLAQQQISAGSINAAIAALRFFFTVTLGAIAFQNKAAVYDLLFRTAAKTLTTIAADPRHLGACIGLTAVLHTWGSALTHHPHVHVIVPGGGLSPDGARWIACRPSFFLPVRVLSRLFRRLFLNGLAALKEAGRLDFFGDLAPLADQRAFVAALAPLRRCEWVVYAKRPFAGPEAVLAYLARYTHRVAISNSRLVALGEASVTFKWKDYRIKGRDRLKIMSLDAAEFIRRFLLHVLPSGFHRIRHYGLFAGTVRARNIERLRQALAAPKVSPQSTNAEAERDAETPPPTRRCPCCGGRMVIIETFEGARPGPSAPPSRIRIDTS